MIDYDELRSCTRCGLSKTRERVVIGSGPRHAPLMVVGEAPGRNEDEGGEPFIGRSGRLLFQLLDEEVGVTRERCFVTNVVKCRPPMNRTPTKEELTACRPWFLGQLEDCAPLVVLALGNTAARAVFGYTEGMGEIHGRVCRLGQARGIASYHPAAALRAGPSVVDVMRADLRILKRLLETV
jgi:DNA polymerase